MSDCHIWFGRARSKRRGGLGPRGRCAGAAPIRPSSCRIRRTVASDTPSPSKRARTSRIRRVPALGSSRLACTTACRRGSLSRSTPLLGSAWPRFFGMRPSTPPSWYRRTHVFTVVWLRP